MSSDIEQFGWTAVVRDASKLLGGEVYINKPTPLTVDDIPFPSDDEIVARVQQYAQKELLQQTYHHSMRVYYFSKLRTTLLFIDSSILLLLEQQSFCAKAWCPSDKYQAVQSRRRSSQIPNFRLARLLSLRFSTISALRKRIYTQPISLSSIKVAWSL